MIVGKAKNLRLSQLVIDPRVQRYVYKSSIKKIAGAWDWIVFTPVIVVVRKGCYSVVDGQNRLMALRRVHPDYAGLIPCWILPKMTVAQEADLLLKLNENNKPVGPADRFHIGLTAKHEPATTTNECLRRAGIIPRYGKCKLGWNETRCAHKFMDAYLLVGSGGLREVIKCAMACRLGQGEIDPDALKAIYLDGATEYVCRGGKAGKYASVNDVLKRAGRSSGTNGRKRAPAIADVLERMWQG